MKSLTIQFTLQPDYLQADLSGTFDFQELVGFISLLKKEAVDKDIKNIYIDLMNVDGMLSNIERFRLGEILADHFRIKYKVLVIERNERINKLAENTAVNRGLMILVTDNEQEGLAWLAE